MRVLRDKFQWEEAAIQSAGDLMSGFTEQVAPTRRLKAVPEDPSDDRILECAISSDSEFLITGDRHLLKLGSFERTKIITPAQFLAIFRGGARK